MGEYGCRRGDAVQLLLVVGDAGAQAAHGEARAHDQRVAELLGDLVDFLDAVGDVGAGGFGAGLVNDLLEQFTVLATVDGFQGSTDQFDVVLLQDAGLAQRHGGVSAVWPPKVGRSASGRSLAMICSRIGVEIGSM